MAAHFALVSTLAPDTRLAADALVTGGAGTNCTKYLEIYFSSGDDSVDPGDFDPHVRGDLPGVREGGVIGGERMGVTSELGDVFDPGV